MTHRRAVFTMVVVTLLWSIAGVVTRHLDSARSFEVTFWRSAANAIALGGWLAWRAGGPIALARPLRTSGWLLWTAGACWSVMFTAFMMAMMLTTVANVLVTMALAPLFTAVIARATLGHRLPARTWGAILVAGGGISWMYGAALVAGDVRQWLGTLVALCVPLAGAIMWTLTQRNQQSHPDARTDMLPAVLIGATASALVTLPLSLPWQASAHDVGLLVMLGVVQLAIPCVLAVGAGRVLAAPEASLLGLLEIVFGVAWTWLGTSEQPSVAVVGGGLLVVGALAVNEAIALWGRAALR